MKFTSIHKKIRGMRKKARKLSSWTEYHKDLDIELLLKHQKEYVKLWIRPFYNLYKISNNEIGKKNPPFKFRKQIFYQLIEIYLEWQKKLEQLNQPYYLRIWLANPEFIDSQVVAAVGSEIDYYNKIFLKNDKPKEFPFNIQHPNFGYFEWERCINGYYVWESDLETANEIEEIRAKAFQTYEHQIDGKIERSYFISTGDMWTGSIRGSGNFT